MAKGGSQPSVPDVAPSSITDLANEAVNANIGNLPKLLQAYQQYGPQYASSINDIFAGQQKRLQEIFPDQFGVQKQFAGNLTNALGAIGDAGGMGIPSTLLNPLLEQVRGGQAARGMALSPISALSESQAFGGLAEQYRQGISNEALQFLNTSPLTTPGSMQDFNTLGLTPISNTDLLKGGIMQDEARVNNAYTQFSYQQQQANNALARRQGLGKSLGAAGGMALGALLAAPTGGMSLMAGAALGGGIGAGLGQAGGTYF